jgi:uncharacterized iron-regulated membrane protein
MNWVEIVFCKKTMDEGVLRSNHTFLGLVKMFFLLASMFFAGCIAIYT